jgi:sugar phosphate isomerase/epimerase
MKLSAVFFFTDILLHRRNLYSRIVKNKISPAPDVFLTLKKNGLDGIELLLPQFIKVKDEDLLEVKKILNEHEMPVLSVHQQLRFFTKTRMKEINELFHTAKLLGSKVIVLHMNSAGKQVFDAEYIHTIHNLQKQYGIRVGFENMEKFFGSLHRKHSWHEDVFADLMHKNDFFITFDVQHLAHSGGDISRFFKKNKQRIVNIHLSDYRFHMLNSSFRPLRYKHLQLGKGELPIKEFLHILKEEKYNGLVTMEIHADLAQMCESAQMVRAILKKDS